MANSVKTATPSGSPKHGLPSGNVPVFLPECARLSLILLGVFFILASLISIGVLTDLYNVFRIWPYGIVCFTVFIAGAAIVGLGCRCWLRNPIISPSVQMKMLRELEQAEQEAKHKKRDSIRRIYHKLPLGDRRDRNCPVSSV